MLANRKGFSLIEMAIVLIILGLVLSSASGIISMFINMGASERSRERISANRSALISIAAEDGYLQKDDIGTRPANVNLSYPLDIFDKKFEVFLADDIQFRDDDDELNFSPVCGASGTTLRLEICENSDCDTDGNLVNNIAFVIVSGYKNRNIQTNVDIIDNEIRVHLQGSVNDDYNSDLARAEDYDDIVDWVTLSELRSKAGCDPERLTIKSSEIPVIESGDEFEFNLYTEGGVPFPQSGASEVEEYTFEITDDGGLDPSDVRIMVYQNGGESPISESVSARGEYLVVRSNSTSLGNSSYRVIIKVRDDGGNEIGRTLYIKTMD